MLMTRLTDAIRDRLDRFRSRPAVHERLLYWVYGPEFRRWCRSRSCEVFTKRLNLYQYLLELEGLHGPIDYLEFGVFKGTSYRWWAENNRHAESSFVGFDSFEGLPEGWSGWAKGAFSTGGQLPEISDRRCSFVKGLFQDTLPRWLTGRDFSRRTVINLDADLYSSTLLVLTQLLPKLRNDDILILDEFSSYLHEYRAFSDATAAYPKGFVPVARTDNWGVVAMKAT
jgi:hypothetical protein